MLILTRNIGQKIIIDNKTEFAILGIKGRQVRLGITAPLDVSIHREEIQDKINAEKGKKIFNGEY